MLTERNRELSNDITHNLPTGRHWPDRTGIWQFMSARALIDGADKGTTIPDELESVFNVLLYMAMRFLPHNRSEFVERLLYDYFDDYQKTAQGYGCGTTKLTAMRHGEIVILRVGVAENLRFFHAEDSDAEHPINVIICELLQWFKAYYAVRYRKTDPPPSKPTNKPGRLITSALRQRILMRGRDVTATLQFEAPAHDNLDASQPAVSGTSNSANATSGSARQTAVPLTTEDKILADKLTSHEAMVALFEDCFEIGRDWPDSDKREDRRRRVKGGIHWGRTSTTA